VARGERIELRWFLWNDAIAAGFAIIVLLGFSVLVLVQLAIGVPVIVAGEAPEDPGVWTEPWIGLGILAFLFAGPVVLRWLYLRWLLSAGTPCEATVETKLQLTHFSATLHYRYRWQGREYARGVDVLPTRWVQAIANRGRATALVHPRLPYLACVREIYRAPEPPAR
jgi:hypothetical protein